MKQDVDSRERKYKEKHFSPASLLILRQEVCILYLNILPSFLEKTCSLFFFPPKIPRLWLQFRDLIENNLFKQFSTSKDCEVIHSKVNNWNETGLHRNLIIPCTKQYISYWNIYLHTLGNFPLGFFQKLINLLIY